MLLVTSLITLAALVVTLMYLVPPFTNNGVVINHDSAFRATLAYAGISLVNTGLWFALAVVVAIFGVNIAAGTLAPVGILASIALTFVPFLVNATAIFLFGRAFPKLLYVRSFGSALWASLLLGLVVNLILMIV